MKIEYTLPIKNVIDPADLTSKSADTTFAQVLDAAKASTKEEEIKEAAQQLEAMFLYQLFSQMRKTVPEGTLFGGEKLAGNIFQGMFDQEVSVQAALNGGTGLAEIIYQQMVETPNRGKP